MDGVSGATLTSNAILTAVSDALAQAGGSAATSASATSATSAKSDATASTKADTAASAKAETSTAAAAGSYTDGTYEASAQGKAGDVPVTVTITDGKISAVEVGDNSETQGVGSKAIEQLPAKIVEANGTDGVDGVSGASVTSKAIFTAVNDALDQAKA